MYLSTFSLYLNNVYYVKGYICSFPVMTHQDVRCEQALLLVTFYSKNYEIRVHVSLLMDCGVFMEVAL